KAINRSRHFEQRLQSKLDEIIEQTELTEEDEQAFNNLLAELHGWKEYYDWIRRVAAVFESGEVFEHVPKRSRKYGCVVKIKPETGNFSPRLETSARD